MPYQIIQSYSNFDPPALGTSFTASPDVSAPFSPIYTTIDQAYENLKMLLLTRVGERYGYPQFGTFLLNILFQPSTDEIKAQIPDLITKPVSVFLPYLNIDNIDIKTAQDDPTLPYSIQIKLDFSLNSIETNTITISATESGQLSVS